MYSTFINFICAELKWCCYTRNIDIMSFKKVSMVVELFSSVKRVFIDDLPFNCYSSSSSSLDEDE